MCFEADIVSLEEEVVRELKKWGYTLTTAESCTGGMIASRICNVPGASEVLMQGLVTYSNEAKMRYLGVKKETLDTLGAVSWETAGEMSLGGWSKTGTNVCISVTGIAGPGGGSSEKPVGLVYMGCCVNGENKVMGYRFSGDRTKIRQQSATAALNLILNCLAQQRQ